MKLTNIVTLFNSALAGERYAYTQIIHLLDKAIDDINNDLQAIYPTFSELPDGSTDYDLFPDIYIRQVVVIGAAYYHYIEDEEGISTAPQYMLDYNTARFKMLRDYMTSVPELYQRTNNTALYFARDTETGERGVTLDATTLIP